MIDIIIFSSVSLVFLIIASILQYIKKPLGFTKEFLINLSAGALLVACVAYVTNKIQIENYKTDVVCAAKFLNKFQVDFKNSVSHQFKTASNYKRNLKTEIEIFNYKLMLAEGIFGKILNESRSFGNVENYDDLRIKAWTLIIDPQRKKLLAKVSDEIDTIDKEDESVALVKLKKLSDELQNKLTEDIQFIESSLKEIKIDFPESTEF